MALSSGMVLAAGHGPHDQERLGPGSDRAGQWGVG